MNRRVYKTSKGSMVAGVCAGLGEYFNIDATLIRLGFVALVFAGGSGLLAYIVAAIILPDKEDVADDQWRSTGEDRHYYDQTTIDENDSGWQEANQENERVQQKSNVPRPANNNQALLAYILIGIGTYMLLDRYVNWRRISHLLRPFWPLAIVAVGVVILVNSSRRA